MPLLSALLSIRRVLSDAGVRCPREMIISLGRPLPAASCGGVKGATEPSLIPSTHFLLAPP